MKLQGGSLIFILLLLYGCGIIHERRIEMISQQQALEISNKKAKELKYDTAQMEVVFVNQGTFLFDHFNHNKKISNELEGKDYWVIYYRPKGMVYGGDLFISVDKETGKIINYLRGQ